MERREIDGEARKNRRRVEVWRYDAMSDLGRRKRVARTSCPDLVVDLGTNHVIFTWMRCTRSIADYPEISTPVESMISTTCRRPFPRTRATISIFKRRSSGTGKIRRQKTLHNSHTTSKQNHAYPSPKALASSKQWLSLRQNTLLSDPVLLKQNRE